MNTWMMLKMQDANSLTAETMIWFHELVMMIMIIIMTGIFYLMICILKNKFTNRNLLQGHLIEIIWTLVPMLILFFLSIPSLQVLYMSDEMYYPSMSVKAIGHQWYWSYEYPDFNVEFDSYMLKSSNPSNFRLLDVDNRMILPKKISMRIMTTSTDVIHSWAMPSLGMKMDSIPGRMNQMPIFMLRPGLFFGQCSEICGANHSFMPIVIESVNLKNFMHWLNTM